MLALLTRLSYPHPLFLGWKPASKEGVGKVIVMQYMSTKGWYMINQVYFPWTNVGHDHLIEFVEKLPSRKEMQTKYMVGLQHQEAPALARKSRTVRGVYHYLVISIVP